MRVRGSSWVGEATMVAVVRLTVGGGGGGEGMMVVRGGEGVEV